jgi:hypothetical protein
VLYAEVKPRPVGPTPRTSRSIICPTPSRSPKAFWPASWGSTIRRRENFWAVGNLRCRPSGVVAAYWSMGS